MAFPLLPILKALPVLLPVVVDVVRIVEQIFGDGNGESKKEAALDILTTIIRGYESFRGDVLDENALRHGVEMIIDGVVEVLNSTGGFNRANL